jgi:Tfp pilus assembly protein PilN
MIRINLAATERATTKKKAAGAAAPGAPGAFQAYLLLVLFVGGAAFLCAAGWYYKSSQLRELDKKIADGRKREAELKAIKVQVDAFQAKKTLLENKVNLIEKLKAEQKGPVHMLDEISKSLPDYVWLTDMEQAGSAVKFKGQSNSLSAVADFISNLQRSGWFPQVDLVASTEDKSIITFDLAGQFKNPEVAAREKEAAAKAAAAGPPPPPGAPPKKS